MLEMWKKQQVHENAMNMYRADVLVKERGMMEKATLGRGSDLVQKMFGPCEAENWTKIDEVLQSRASGHKRARQNVETNSGS